MKFDPSCIEIPVPRYFKEDDLIPVEITFKEKVDRSTKKKKKKQKKKKKKKKQKKEDKPKPEKISLEKKR